MNESIMKSTLNRGASSQHRPSRHLADPGMIVSDQVARQRSASLTLRDAIALGWFVMVWGLRALWAGGLMICRASFPRPIMFILLASSAGALQGGEKDAAKPLTAQLFSAGIVDASGRIGYVDNGKDTIVAIELTTGKELWKSGGVMQPIMGFEGQLLVLVWQDRELRLHWIEAATGKFMRASSPMALPKWSDRPIRLGGRGGIQEGDLLLECFITEDSNGGAAPHTSMIHARIALDTGKVTLVPAGEAGQSFSQLAPKDLKKVGELTFDITQTTESKAPHFLTMKRTLRALNAEGKVVWTRKLPDWEIGPPKP